MMIQESHLMNHEHFVQEKQNEVKTLFLLESPGKTELEKGYPCAGPSGKVMSKALLKIGSDSDKALGELIAGKNPNVSQYAIFDTFKFPLKKDDLKPGETLNESESIWQNLKDVEQDSWHQCKKMGCHSAKITNKISEFNRRDRSIFNEYKNSLGNCLKLFPNLEEIVVCGFIAQCMFKEYSGLSEWPYNKWISWTHKNVYVLRFVKHPRSCLDDKGNVIVKNGKVDWQYSKHRKNR